MKQKLLSGFLFGISMLILWNCSSELPTLKVARSPQKDILSFKFEEFTPAAEEIGRAHV